MATRTQFIDRPSNWNRGSLYDSIVEAWNRLKPWERRDRVNECTTKGHDWGALSWGPHVCKRCLRYDKEA